MLRRSALVLLLLLASVGCAGALDSSSTDGAALTSGSGAIDTSLPDVDALGYAIDLTLNDDVGHESFDAAVKGTYVATKNLDALTLDFSGNTISDVKVGERNAEYHRDGDKLTIKLPERVASGATFSTRITYHGDLVQADGMNPDDFKAFGGFMVRQKNAEHRRVINTLSWPSKARRWLPLRDHPRDSAAVSINATFPRTFTVIANGRKTGVDHNGDGSWTWHYEEKSPMPVYDFHITAYDNWQVDEKRHGELPITLYTYPSDAAKIARIYDDVSKVMDFYQANFGAYRYAELNYIEEPIYGGGMEHASVISMDESLIDDPKQARTTAFHELGHHWSGNAVHIRTWNDFWLNEGYAEYLMARAVEFVDGDKAGKLQRRAYLSSMIAAEKETPHPVAPPGQEIDVLTIFDDIPYEKGALVLNQLESLLGREKFTSFSKTWFETHGLGAAVTTDQFKKELAQAAGKNLDQFFEEFVRTTGHPEVVVSYEGAGADVTVTVKQIQDVGPREGFHFPLGLDLIDESGHTQRVTVDLTGKSTTKRVHVDGNPVKSIAVDPDEAMVGVVSCGQSGGDRCRDGFRCLPQRENVSVCVPE